MKKFVFTILLAIGLIPAYSQTDNSEGITTALKSGNAKEISKYFNSTINLKILTKEDVYSKAQAEIILKDFFSKNTPKGYTAKHTGTSKNGAQYTIGQLSTSSGNFRTYYFVKKTGDTYLIQEFRIENED